MRWVCKCQSAAGGGGAVISHHLLALFLSPGPSCHCLLPGGPSAPKQGGSCFIFIVKSPVLSTAVSSIL
jgi:hypothetical protein